MAEKVSLTPSGGKAFVQRVLSWSTDNLRDFPWRRWPDVTPYDVLVAELLLKRTTAEAAQRTYPRFLEDFPDIKSLRSAGHFELQSAFKNVGLYNQRALATAKLAAYLDDVHGGEIPSDLAHLMAVPGLGPYSARAILSLGYDIPNAVVDSNVQRVFSRVFKKDLSDRTSQGELQDLADFLLPVAEHRRYNLALLDLGSLVCRPGAPKCNSCPVLDICDNPFPLDTVSTRREGGIGLWLREERRKNGLTLSRLAELSGVSKSTVINIESDRVIHKGSTISRLKVAFDD